ncbi:response regulator transcription factor [Siculibacillus lacustris]|uniref:Response regulator transcription factor n=1 Tax=Siculibacillus lacustris TaxID=1549641 RepID=A0A4Q9W068_9HYPH|nr:response regulator transcription factor [Siculibacillus lacustris]TBW41373.1 response regulator transcription factor [Siculibacillus lacustris]
MRVLIVEDDRIVAAGLREGLGRTGLAVDHAETGEDGFLALTGIAYDLAIIDLGLPDMDGRDLIRRVRERQVAVPILVLTARDDLDDKVACLDFGADDHLVKPFELTEVAARIRALVRRSRKGSSTRLRAGELDIDLARREVRHGDTEVPLTLREWDIMERLVSAAPEVLSKRKLVEGLSSWDNELTANAIELYVSRLRTKIEGCGVRIRTIRGIGYRLDED